MLTTLYYSLIYPYLTYGIILWGAACQSHLAKLTIMQKKSVRIISGAHFRAHTETLFKDLRLLKLADLYKLHVNKYVLAFIHNLLPSSLNQIITLSKKQHLHTTQQSTQCKLIANKTRTLA